MVGVIGRSGAGKTTLLRMINRLIEPTSGSVHFDAVDVTTLRGRKLLEWRRRCAMIFQQFGLVQRLDVITNVLLGRLNYHMTVPSLFGLFNDAERAKAIHLLDRFDMASLVLQRVDSLSGGQQQRVAIARALMQDPKIILADEPIASLDARNATLVMDSLRSINQNDGITVICNLHTLDTARAYCNRIVGMRNGRFVFDGEPAEVTRAKVREIYGIEEAEEQLSEEITSISVSRRERSPAKRTSA